MAPSDRVGNAMKTVVVIQARMTSTRLAGKVLLDLDGEPLLARQLARLSRCRRVDEVVIATTVNDSDEPLVELAAARGLGCFRGSEDDVLSRYAGAARQAGADVVVRVTSDCPLLDPGLVDLAVERLAAERCDYVSNTFTRTYPRGLDVEAFPVDVLHRMDRLAVSAPAREHVTWFLHSERPDLFLRRELLDAEDNSDLRWTVDTEDDLAMVRALWRAADCSSRFVAYREILAVARSRPDIVATNAHVAQKQR